MKVFYVTVERIATGTFRIEAESHDDACERALEEAYMKNDEFGSLEDIVTECQQDDY